MTEPSPIFRQMNRLAEEGYLTLTGMDMEEGSSFTASQAQGEELTYIVAHPEMWNTVPVLSQCKDALGELRRLAIEAGAIEA